MFVEVQLLNGFQKTLTYKIPSKLKNQNLEGKLVQVPLRNQQTSALVTKMVPKLASPLSFKIKEIIDLHAFPKDTIYSDFIEKIANFYFVKPLHFYQRIQSFLSKHDANAQDIVPDIQLPPQKTVTLTPEQKEIITQTSPLIHAPAFAPCLIHGVTGSGKTEIYKALIDTCIEQQKSSILLLPEVSLSLQFEYIFKKTMPHITVYGFHSATKPTEKKALWNDLLLGKPILIIGVHLPIVLPVQNLGLIIIDEEHETGFQEKKHPKINSKFVALWRAHSYKIPILLGSATPSLTSLHNINKKKWAFFQLKKRFIGTFPSIKKVLLNTSSKKRRRNFWISEELEQAITQCLEKKEQAIIYLNRRGYSFFVQCKTCGFIFECPNCSVSLTLHRQQINPTQLRCHYCDYHKQMPGTCPECNAASKNFLKKGIGTQQVVHIFQNLFPHARIERADLDTTRKKRSWQQTALLFEQGKIDILIGTKSITKGYHFPSVTLVGILWGDLSLSLPHFNAGETTLQELIQVAGRAGRSTKKSNVIIQLIQDHHIFDYVNEQHYLEFAHKELEARMQTNYPPFCNLLCLELHHKNSDQVHKDALNLAHFLQKNNLGITVLGPAQPVVHRVQRVEMRHIFLKSHSWKNLYQLVQTIKNRPRKSSLFFVYH